MMTKKKMFYRALTLLLAIVFILTSAPFGMALANDEELSDVPETSAVADAEAAASGETAEAIIEATALALDAVPLNSGVEHTISTAAQLTAFLNGTLGANDDTFIIDGSITITGNHQGRGFVDGQAFTGTIRGINNATITGLRLVPRANGASPGAAYRNDIGFVRVLGHGAVIENLTFVDARYTETGAIADWNTTVGNIGLVVGRIMSGSVATIENVTVRGTAADNNAIITTAGPRATAYNSKRVGGLVGATDAGSALTITNSHARVTISKTETATTGSASVRFIPSAGGYIGLAAGVITINGGTTHLATTAAGNTAFEHVGGAIGQLGGAATITGLTSVGGTNTQLGAGSGAANRSVGGFIGSMNGTVTFRNATNNANIQVTQGRIGGFIGRTQGPGQVRIYDSTNLGRIHNTHAGNAPADFTRVSSTGGFIGQADASVHIERSTNGSPANAGTASEVMIRINGRQGGGGFIGITATRGTTTLIDVTNYGRVHGHALRRYLGGFIGHSRNPVTITDGENHGRITTMNNGTAVGQRGFASNLGGFIGQATHTVIINNGINRGTIEALGTNEAGQSGRLRMGGFIGVSTNHVTINTATNHANVWSATRQHTGSEAGGIIGRTEFRGARATRRVNLNDVTNHGSLGYNATGAAASTQGRAGGIVGFSAHRAGAQGLNINGALNTGNIRSAVGSGASNANRSNLMAAGGIVGTLDTLNSSIHNAVNTGRVQSMHDRGTVGGIIGRSSRNNLIITESGNEGVVRNTGTGTQAHTVNMGAGGIVGNIARGNNTRILRSYNAGSVEGSSQSTGGLVGSVRRRGTLLIEDSYNVGSVMARNGTNLGNGILGFRRNNRSVFTMRRVFNSGNVHGAPIYTHLGNEYSGTASLRNAATRMNNRMVYQGVYWDSSIHTGRTQPMTIGFNTNRARPMVGLQGVPTAILTSGTLFEFQSPNWLTRGWVDNWARQEYETWETYPWLAWQTPGVQRGQDMGEFFFAIDPGPCHAIAATSRTVHFEGVHAGNTTLAGGHVNRQVRGVRGFIPYGTRTTGQAEGTTDTPPRLHREHMQRAAGNSSAAVTGITTPYLSVGLLNTQNVVGFNYNERFTDVVVMGVDGPHYREDPTRTTLITWSRISLDGALQNQAISGILALEDITVGQRIDITASPGYAPAYRIITQADVDYFNEHGRLLIRVPMERVAIEHLRVHVLNASAEVDEMPQIVAGRNPQSNRAREATPTAFESLNLATGMTTGGTATFSPVTSIFNANDSYWFDEINGMADQFMGVQISLWFSDIRNPNAAGTAADPFYVVIPIEDISLRGDLFLTRSYEDDEGAVSQFQLPHGGRGGVTAQANPATSVNFTLEFRNPALVAGNPTALAGTGSGSGATGAIGAWNSDGELTGSGFTGSAGTTNRNNAVFVVENATYLTEVRAVQTVPGAAIGGNGLNRSYRASPWIALGELTEYNLDDELVFMLLDLDYEHLVNVRVYERTEILPGHYVDRLLPPARLYHEKDQGLDGEPLFNWPQAVPPSGIFQNVRVFAGEMLIARAEGYVNFGGSPEYASQYATILAEEETAPHVIRMFMEQAPSGRLTGFVLPEMLMHHPDLFNPNSDNREHRPIPEATVVLLAADGSVRYTTSDANGFFEFPGTNPGTYTLFATHPLWGSHTTVPTPLVMPEGGGNQQATIYLDTDTTSGFLLLVDVRENEVTGPRIGDIASAVLNYGAPTSPRTSTYYTPYRRINVNENRNWATGSLAVSAPRFQSETLTNIGAHISEPVPNAQFAIVTVPLLRINDLLIENYLDNYLGAEVPPRRPEKENQSAIAVRGGTTTTLIDAASNVTFGVGLAGEREPSSFEVVTGSDVTLDAGTAYGWTFLGWYTRAEVNTHSLLPADAPWPAPAHGRGAVHTFEMDDDVHFVAAWGNQDFVPRVPDDYTLTVQNLPAHPIPTNPVSGTPTLTAPTGQTPSGTHHAGDVVALASGTRTDDPENNLAFLGWFIDIACTPTGLPAPTAVTAPLLGTNISDIPADNFIAPNVANLTIRAANRTLIALWGCEDGYIGGRFNLTVNNVPPYPATGGSNAIPSQTQSGLRAAGEAVTLNPGARADGLDFLGWYIGTANIPVPGSNISAIAPANFIAPTVDTFVMPARNETLTALWGDLETGIVGGEFILTVNNVPEHPVTGDPARPAGQTPGGNDISAGTAITLNPGTRTDTLIFLGWFRGTENVPAPGTNVSTLAGNANFIETAAHNFVMPAAHATLTALWGCEDGYIGGRFDLTINNVPVHPLTGAAVRPNGQTANQVRSAGETITLASGERTDALIFLGWFRGTEDVPTAGTNVSTLAGNANFTATAGHSFTMPAADVTMTALWGCAEGYIGGNFELVISNIPTLDPLPEDQTPSGHYLLGATIDLVEGTLAAEHDYQFFGWIRGDVLPSVGDNIDDWLYDNPTVVMQDAGHSFDMPATVTRYTAIWGNHRIVGGDSHRLTFYFYDADGGIDDKHVMIPLLFENGYALVDADVIADIMTQMEEENETAENPYGLAFWGWFTDAEFEAEDRTSDRTGRRRPTVGTTGFDASQPISYTWFADNATNGNIDFYAIFSLWGDVNDDDVVNLEDLDLLARFVRNLLPSPPINLAPADVHRDGVVNLEDLDVLARYVRNLLPRPILGQRPQVNP